MRYSGDGNLEIRRGIYEHLIPETGITGERGPGVLHQRNVKKVGRNDPCPCGSGMKYKKCCMNKEGNHFRPVDVKSQYAQKYRIRLKEEKDVEGIRKAGRLVVDTLDLVEERIRPGMKTDEINTIVHEYTLKHGAIPAPLNYRGYPKSVCVSLNEVICHGIPGDRVVEDGDIVNVDVTSILNGYYADASKTYFVGKPGVEAKKIVEVARNSLRIGLRQVKPGNTVGDIGWAIQLYAEGEGCSVVREFVGHGVGLDFHEPPQVPHYGRKGEGVPLVPGMVFTVEPMINLGKKDLYILDDEWTAVTEDGSLSAQFEQTVLVTQTGFESLTPFEI
jgi:methionyl aminopeptidase